MSPGSIQSYREWPDASDMIGVDKEFTDRFVDAFIEAIRDNRNGARTRLLSALDGKSMKSKKDK